MRSKNAKLNTLTGFLNEVVVVVGGLIVPRLILTHFGSSYNGLVGSITKFMSFSVIFYAGLGAVTRKALYKPFADNNELEISEIFVSTRQFMKRTAIIIGISIIIFAFIYPFFVGDQFDWFYTFILVIIIGASSFADSYFGITNKILLQADQKYYIQTLFNTVTYFISMVISIILILCNQSIHIVKLGAALAFFINPLMLNLYVKKYYKINNTVKPNSEVLKQRSDAFIQQVANIINNNIDIVLLTIFMNTKEISVYTIHFMVINNIGKLVLSCVNGMGSIFGNMMAKKENLNSGFQQFEWFLFAISVVLFSVTTIMISSFVQVYTKNIYDVNYYRPLFAFLLTSVSMMGCLRLPYQMVVEAAGHFKQMRNGAILEVVLNLVLSIVFLNLFGIIGVVIGTYAATTVRTIQYSFYSMRHIINMKKMHVLRMYFIYGLTYLIISSTYFVLPEKSIQSYFSWVFYAAMVFIGSSMFTLVVSLVFNKKEMKNVLRKLFYRRRK